MRPPARFPFTLALSPRRTTALLALASLAAAIALPLPPALGARAEERGMEGEGPLPPLSHSGRWFTDATGRVVLLHGFNNVAKSAPFYPEAFGFGEDDAALLQREGFTALRLGVEFQGLMPAPGEVDES